MQGITYMVNIEICRKEARKNRDMDLWA